MNYNSPGAAPQQPIAERFMAHYEQGKSYTSIMQSASLLKMFLVRYYYTAIVGNSMDGAAFYQPLFFAFPGDPGTLSASLENNVMLGAGIKLSHLGGAVD